VVVLLKEKADQVIMCALCQAPGVVAEALGCGCGDRTFLHFEIRTLSQKFFGSLRVMGLTSNHALSPVTVIVNLTTEHPFLP